MREPREGDPLAYVRAERPRPWWDVDPRSGPLAERGLSLGSLMLVFVGLFSILAVVPGGRGYARFGSSTGLEYVGLHVAALLAMLALRFPGPGRRRIGLFVLADLFFAAFVSLRVLGGSWDVGLGWEVIVLGTGAGLFALGVLGLTCVGGPRPALVRATVVNALLIATPVALGLVFGLASFAIVSVPGPVAASARGLAMDALVVLGLAIPVTTVLGWAYVLAMRAYTPVPLGGPQRAAGLRRAARRAAAVTPPTAPPPTVPPRPS